MHLLFSLSMSYGHINFEVTKLLDKYMTKTAQKRELDTYSNSQPKIFILMVHTIGNKDSGFYLILQRHMLFHNDLV